MIKQVGLLIACLILSSGGLSQDRLDYEGGIQELNRKYNYFVDTFYRSLTEDEISTIERFVENYELQSTAETDVDALPPLQNMADILSRDNEIGDIVNVMSHISLGNVAFTITKIALTTLPANAEDIVREQLPYVNGNRLSEIHRLIEQNFPSSFAIALATESAERGRISWQEVFRLKFEVLEADINSAKIDEYNTTIPNTIQFYVPEEFEFTLMYEYINEAKALIWDQLQSSPAGIEGIESYLLSIVGYFEDFFGCGITLGDQNQFELACDDNVIYSSRRKESGVDPEVEKFIITHHEAAGEIADGADAYDVLSRLYNFQGQLISGSVIEVDEFERDETERILSAVDSVPEQVSRTSVSIDDDEGYINGTITLIFIIVMALLFLLTYGFLSYFSRSK